jgi:hypothetical protein
MMLRLVLVSLYAKLKTLQEKNAESVSPKEATNTIPVTATSTATTRFLELVR